MWREMVTKITMDSEKALASALTEKRAKRKMASFLYYQNESHFNLR